MVNRKIILATEEFYHILNRIVADEPAFDNKHNLNRVLDLVDFYRFKTDTSYSTFKDFPTKVREDFLKKLYETTPLVDIFCFSFMPNHYHLVVKQLIDNGINLFISNFQNAFARFYNLKSKRKGSLFCHPFERIRIENEKQFIHVTRYVHLNHVTAYIIKLDELESYPYSSYMDYMGKRNLPFLNKEYILNHFKNIKNYSKFIKDQEDYQKKLQKIKNLLKD